MFDLIGQALINAGTFLQQASTGSTEVDSIVSIILAVAAIAGVVGTFLKTMNKDSKLGQMLDTFSQKGVENEEMSRRVAAAVVEMFPEMGDALKKHGADLKYMEERVVKGSGQLDVLRSIVLKEKEKAKHVDMPRESKPVF